MRKFLSVVFLGLFLGLPGFGQTLDTKKLDSLFDALNSRNLALGNIAISSNGKVAYRRAVGFAALEGDQTRKATTETRYRIGSVSKLFTAVMIFQLIDEGKLSLEQKLAAFFPELPNASKITIGQLLSHRSGLHNYTADDTGFPDWMDKPKSHEEMLHVIAAKTPDFEPGARSEYCNTNYLLLSYILEKTGKMPYARALEQRITSKISLKDTYYGQKISPENHESRSYKYAEGSWKSQKETDLSIHSGAGAIVSTPTDLVKFIEALFAHRLVKPASLERMKTMVDGYGMGLFPYDFGAKTGYGHNGRIEEFYSALRYFPETKLAIAYCTNGILYPRTDILDAVLKISFRKPDTIPFSQPNLLKSKDLDAYLGSYSSTQLPIVVTCTKAGSQLVLETKGKSFEVVPINSNYFMHAPTGTFFEFHPDKGELLIKETDNVYELRRK
ncbi:serine hydrolase domain-containing protein [Larkinella terrae]|uniref:Serine hydrolase n=1 Tax=Larkinella terrae TaxID=2025311 RepID=A0A7K0ES29_9BACT|nr:serine hydrolase domain-containing protein [Larkinella terrae]MRS64624.1 serine hydrolase [Larkinella terrae]